MPQKPCPIEPLVSSKYCQLSTCPECNIVNLNLPGRISFQFDITQFLEIVDAFNKAAQRLRVKDISNEKSKNIIKINQLH